MKFEIDREKYIESGLVDEKEHPTFPLLIYNYTPVCQFSKSWDITTRMCRGLIVNKETREIVARPFKKFFNYEEHMNVPDMEPIPTEKPIVYPKFDGSLGILYWWEDRPYIATRGSFTSDQAQWANNFINKGGVSVWIEKLDKSKTYLFEIIYPENRIVVNYGREDLVLLAVIDTETGRTVIDGLESTDFPFVSKYPFGSYEDLKSLNTPNEEGFVLLYPERDMRVKIKFDEYVKLHKVITGLSAIGIWEMLKDGKDLIQIIQDIPDEMHDWVRNVAGKILGEFVAIECSATLVETEALKLATRKEQAEVISKSQYSGIIFSMLDKKDYKLGIWRIVRPKGKQVFRNDIDS